MLPLRSCVFRLLRRLRVASQDSVEGVANVFESVFAFDHLQSRGFAAHFARALLPKLRIEVHVHLAVRVEEILYRIAEFVVGPGRSGSYGQPKGPRLDARQKMDQRRARADDERGIPG